eukprot:8471751-Pyramimonas_sp.AAC.1
MQRGAPRGSRGDLRGEGGRRKARPVGGPRGLLGAAPAAPPWQRDGAGDSPRAGPWRRPEESRARSSGGFFPALSR